MDQIQSLKGPGIFLVLAFFICSFSQNSLLAQEAIATSGGDAAGSGGSQSYSVGQVVYTTNANTEGAVEQGIQQAYKITALTGIEKTEIVLEMTAYPNPTKDILTLLFRGGIYSEKKVLTYQLYDINGKLLLTKELANEETSIPMYGYLPGTYFLKIASEKEEIKVFQILKN